MESLPKNKKIILFDGVCHLCNASVEFVIQHDKKDIFRFVTLQSDLGIAIIKHIGIDSKNIDSIILYEPGVAYYYKSTAALEIAKDLSGLFHYASLFRIIPTFLRNPIYDYVAKNRYKWYGKQVSCMIPKPEMENRFL
jgi:predicted DCC family thiol-disulfide oxidoreductase YuxK